MAEGFADEIFWIELFAEVCRLQLGIAKDDEFAHEKYVEVLKSICDRVVVRDDGLIRVEGAAQYPGGQLTWAESTLSAVFKTGVITGQHLQRHQLDLISERKLN